MYSFKRNPSVQPTSQLAERTLTMSIKQGVLIAAGPNEYYTGRFDCCRTARRTADGILATMLFVPQDSVLLSPPLEIPSVVFRC